MKRIKITIEIISQLANTTSEIIKEINMTKNTATTEKIRKRIILNTK